VPRIGVFIRDIKRKRKHVVRSGVRKISINIICGQRRIRKNVGLPVVSLNIILPLKNMNKRKPSRAENVLFVIS